MPTLSMCESLLVPRVLHSGVMDGASCWSLLPPGTQCHVGFRAALGSGMVVWVRRVVWAACLCHLREAPVSWAAHQRIYGMLLSG